MAGNGACNINSTTGERKQGWNRASAALPIPPTPAFDVTGLRYAFGDDPCCPNVNRGVVPCPPGSCPIKGYNSTLPAVPFVATVRHGNCTWISTTGGQVPP